MQAVQTESGIVLVYGAVGGSISDVRVNGTSVVTEGIADVPVPTKTSDLQNDSGFLTSVAFNDLTSHPTTLDGYGITDAKVDGGTVMLGNTSITPVTDISYNTETEKLQKTVNGTVTDVVTLHKVARTGNYSDLTGNPWSVTDLIL